MGGGLRYIWRVPNQQQDIPRLRELHKAIRVQGSGRSATKVPERIFAVSKKPLTSRCERPGQKVADQFERRTPTGETVPRALSRSNFPKHPTRLGRPRRRSPPARPRGGRSTSCSPARTGRPRRGMDSLICSNLSKIIEKGRHPSKKHY